MSPATDPALSARGRALVGARWANTADRTAATAPARVAFLTRFEKQVDPDGTLPEHERQRRAIEARRAYFADLAARSADARRARSGAPDDVA